MRHWSLRMLLVLALVSGLFVIPQASQAAGIRITVSIRVMITITTTYTTTRASSPPAEASLSPTDVQVVPGTTGSSSAVISWNPPASGAPSGGYTVRFATINKTAIPENGGTWTESKYDAASNVNEMLVTDIAPSSRYQIIVTANDGYGTHYSETSNFCSAKYYATDAGCILTIAATTGKSLTIPNSNIDATSATSGLPDKAVKSGAIDVTWSAADNVNSYLVQWTGYQYPIEYGEKSVPAGTTSTTISGLTGSKLHYIKVFALGGNGGYSESNNITAYSSPGATSAPVLSKGTDSCIGVGDFVVIRINSQTPLQSDINRAQPQNASIKLSTKAFLTRFRKEGATSWQNADVALKDKTRCFTDSPYESAYPDPKELRAYFLPDATSNFEFQVSEVSNTPTGGAIAGDWSYSVWFGPNAVALSRNVVAQEGSDGLAQRENASAVARYNAYKTYLANVVAAQKAATPVATPTTAPTNATPSTTTPSASTPSTTTPSTSGSAPTPTTAGSGGFVASYNDKCTRAPDAPIVTYKRAPGSYVVFNATVASTGMPATNLNYRTTEWNGKTQKWGEWSKITTNFLSEASAYIFSSGETKRASFAVYASNKCGNSAYAKESSNSDGIPIDEDSIAKDYRYFLLEPAQSGIQIGELAKAKSGAVVSATSTSLNVCSVNSGKLMLLSSGTCELKFTSPDTDYIAGGSATNTYTVLKGTNKVTFNYESSGVRITVMEQEQIKESLKVADSSSPNPAKLTITNSSSPYCDVSLDPTAPGLLVVTGKKIGYCGISGKTSDTPLMNSVSFDLGVYVVENPRLIAEAKAKAAADAKAAAEAKASADAKAAAEAKASSDAQAAAVVAAANNKKVTITCVKGKLTKKVTGAAPKCPAGYKKKS